MSEAAAMWFFLSIAAICYTWHKVASIPRPRDTTAASDMKFLYNGKPVNGSIEITVDGRTGTYKVVDGKIA